MLIEIKDFLRNHLIHFLLLPIFGLTIFTAMHEGAHGIAVIIQGGTIDSFRWWPTQESLGRIEYSFAENINYSNFLISMAPYFLWSIVISFAIIISFLLKTNDFKIYSTVFIWIYLLPLIDIGHHALQYFRGAFESNDFYDGLGESTSTIKGIIFICLILMFYISYIVHKNLYQQKKLSVKSFAIMSLMTILIIAI